MNGLRRFGLALIVVFGVLPASAQESLDRGKTPQQLFATDCAVCHKSPQGLAKAAGFFGLQEFLRKHYTASRESALALSNYLNSVGDAPAAKPAAKKPAQKKEAAKPADAKPGETKPADARPADTKPTEASAKADEKKEQPAAAATGAAPKSDPFPDVKPTQPAAKPAE